MANSTDPPDAPQDDLTSRQERPGPVSERPGSPGGRTDSRPDRPPARPTDRRRATSPRPGERPPSRPPEPSTIRLQVALARAGVASRRAAEELIEAGRVGVNGQTVRVLGTKVDPAADQITVDGRPVVTAEELVYYALYKPYGIVSTVSDEYGRENVLDLVPDERRIYPVGRLDADSEGLIVLTNDGELTRALTHPSSLVDKEYHVLVRGPVAHGDVSRLRNGILLDDRYTAPAQVEAFQITDDGDTWLRFIVHEGRKRQIRRMLSQLRYRTERLVRVRIGPLRLGRLKPGEYRALNRGEVRALRRAAD
ncbi:MAG: rRNA pseudouridine synthase [Chloroflexi bacterium]|nr:rRNA pseudouridine synthase [Chloroflexota bacterium]